MRRITLIILLLLSLPVAWEAGEPVRAQENLIKNPGFEQGFFHWSGINEIYVAHEWTPWWRERTEADPPATFFKPEYKKADGYIYPNRVHSGAAAQQWFTFYSTHQAGLYQQVFGVTPGVRYRFTIWAHVWSSTEDDPLVSFDPAYPNLQIGIDTTGNWSAWDSDIVWSGTHGFFDHWGQLAVEAVAENNVITVFLRSEPNFPVKHNDMYWDDAVLVAVGGAPAPPPPAATSPPLVVTCTTPPADWVTYHVQRGDTLYSLAKSRGVTLDEVVAANCLDETNIYVGQALSLPPLAASATPRPVSATPRPPTATPRPTSSPTAPPTRTAIPTTVVPTTAPATPTPSPAATETPAPVAAVTASPTRPQPTIRPPFTPASSPAPPVSTPSSDGDRPCGTIAVGVGIALFAGVLGFRRRDKSV